LDFTHKENDINISQFCTKLRTGFYKEICLVEGTGKWFGEEDSSFLCVCISCSAGHHLFSVTSLQCFAMCMPRELQNWPDPFPDLMA